MPTPHAEKECDLGEIARELGVSRQRVDAILKSALRKLRAALAARGVKSVSDCVPDEKEKTE